MAYCLTIINESEIAIAEEIARDLKTRGMPVIAMKKPEFTLADIYDETHDFARWKSQNPEINRLQAFNLTKYAKLCVIAPCEQMRNAVIPHDIFDLDAPAAVFAAPNSALYNAYLCGNNEPYHGALIQPKCLRDGLGITRRGMPRKTFVPPRFLYLIEPGEGIYKAMLGIVYSCKKYPRCTGSPIEKIMAIYFSDADVYWTNIVLADASVPGTDALVNSCEYVNKLEDVNPDAYITKHQLAQVEPLPEITLLDELQSKTNIDAAAFIAGNDSVCSSVDLAPCKLPDIITNSAILDVLSDMSGEAKICDLAEEFHLL